MAITTDHTIPLCDLWLFADASDHCYRWLYCKLSIISM